MHSATHHRSIHNDHIQHLTNHSTNHHSRLAVLLGTGLALLITSFSSTQVRLLIDPGSELTFISDHLVVQHHLPRRHSSISICGIGGNYSDHTKGITTITLQSTYSSTSIIIDAHILRKLTTSLPSVSDHQHYWPHIDSLQLADPNYLQSRPINIIIGADSYGQIIENNIVKSSSDSRIAQLTIFGWILLGPINQQSLSTHHSYHSTASNSNEHLQHLLTQFWVQEEIPINTHSQLSSDEQACENHFMSTYSRDNNGRYIVRLPLTSSPSILGDSKSTAHCCLQRLLTKLNKDSTYHQMYSSFLTEYEQLNHMRKADDSSNIISLGNVSNGSYIVGDEMTLAHDVSTSGGLRVSSEDLSSHILTRPMYYLPHHGVFKADSTTTKLRVVFNGSSPSKSGKSLNDIQHTGAKLQKDLCDVLIWFRQHKFMFSSDITKMYRQIKVHQDDWDLQRILWVDEKGNSTSYQLTTVTYGTRSAPFLAIRALLQLVNDESHRFPQEIPSLLKGRYVDDIYGGASQLSELIEVVNQVNDLCMAGGFPLAKWQSNHSQFLNQFSPNSIKLDEIIIDDDSIKLLGLYWHPRTDVFKFKPQPPHSGSKLTKRIILSEIAQLFDPLGFLSPFTVKSKLLMQELWLEKITWDEPVPSHTAVKWIQ